MTLSTLSILILNPQNMALNISLICFNDIANAINVSRNDQNTFHFINLQPSSFPIAAHAKLR